MYVLTVMIKTVLKRSQTIGNALKTFKNAHETLIQTVRNVRVGTQ